MSYIWSEKNEISAVDDGEVWLIFNTLLELKNLTSLNVRLNFQLKYISCFYR